MLTPSAIPTKVTQFSAKVFLCSFCVFPYQAWSTNHSMTSHELCKPELIATQQAIPTKDKKSDIAPKNIEADALLQPSSHEYIMKGNAVLKQPGLVVLSDEARYNKLEKTAVFNGNIELHQPQMMIKADQATINNADKTATLTNTQYQILPSRSHGRSDSIHIDDKQQQAKLAKASLTTCKINSNKSVDWDLQFDDLRIDNTSRRVIGKHTTLYFKDVPIFYTPYFDYPLDNRASGLLFPEIGSYKSLTQTQSNQYLKLPYYFNIAPNIDDTLTAIPMTQRGLAIENEFRYMAKHHDIEHQATFTLTGLQDNLSASEGLVSADTAGNLSYGNKLSKRWRASINASQNWGRGFTSSLVWDDVSDTQFFADIPVQDELKTATQKLRKAQLNYHNDNFKAYIQVLDYLRLQNATINYEKRPEIGVSYAKYMGEFEFDIAATLADFAIDNAAKPEARRFHSTPKLTYQFQNAYSHLTTTLIANQTYYSMNDSHHIPSTGNNIDRMIPQFAIQGGLVFERDIEILGKHYIQTLEPKLQYLYTPYEDQSHIALFDTANRSLDFSNLFELNRFTGADRIGDANQIAAALTTKLQTNTGKPIAEAGIGQIAYFTDRLVTLSGLPETDAFSDVFIKFGLILDNWYFSSTTQLDNQDLTLTNANSRLKWQRQNSILLANHTLNNQGKSNETEMFSLGGYTKIYTNWDLGLYSSYDMHGNDLYETQLGLRYDNCCWGVEFIAERTQLENGLYNDGIQVQFELKGLSSSGTRFQQALTNKLNF